MTEPTRDELAELESELASLRPAGPSDRLREAIGREVEADRRAMRFPLSIKLGAAAAVAACVLVAFIMWRAGDLEVGMHVTAVNIGRKSFPATAAVVPAAPARPALGVYAGALSRSPDALDRLLDEQAAELGSPAGSPRPWVVVAELNN